MRKINGIDIPFIRELYIVSFVNTQCDAYRARTDGQEYYSGCLWDCLYNKSMITQKKAIDFLWNCHSVFLMADCCSCKMQDGCKSCEGGCIYYGEIDELLSVMQEFPEDIYFFDESLSWTIALTHEYNDKGRRYCLITDGRM